MKGSDEMETDTYSRVPKLLTTKQLSQLTGIAYWRVLELVKQGKGPRVMRIGTTLRFPEDGVLEWIAEQSKRE